MKCKLEIWEICRKEMEMNDHVEEAFPAANAISHTSEDYNL